MFTSQSIPKVAQVSLGLILALGFVPPTLAQIVPNGAGTVVNSQGNQINIIGGTQAGGNLFHSFRDFNLTSSQIANFLSNPQTRNILGRINGGNPSFINGLLQVSGGNSNLFLMNPSGIIFGANARLNVPASFTATTANSIGFGNNNLFNAFGDNNFSALIGNPDSFLFTTTPAGSIVNAGNLSVTPGQGISLIGGNVINTGNINAGNITLAAVPGTNRVRISQPGQLLSLEIVPPVNSEIRAVDLPRLLTGQSLPGISSNGSTVEVAGITVPTGQGVNITSGNLSLASPLPVGEGSGVRAINILGDRVALVNANLNASGIGGGGTIRIGGEYHGGGNNPFNSRITFVDSNSFLNADAINSGNGGRVIVWGDDTTRFYGNISATGGANAGNGGFAEVSGAQNLTFAGNADLAAPRGSLGTLLLDPLNILINNVGPNSFGTCVSPNFTSCGPGTVTITQATLQALPATANIVLDATNDITFGTLSIPPSIPPFSVPTLAFAACLSGTCGSVSFNAGGAFNTNGNDIIASGRNLTITAANITAATIDTSTTTANLNGGIISLTANSGNISTGIIHSSSTTSTSYFSYSGNGGAINLSSQGNLSTGNISSSSFGNVSGNGGAINLSSQGTLSTGNINSSSFANGSGNGGAINLSSQGTLSTGNIKSSASSSSLVSASSGNGGAINLSSQGTLSTGDIDSSTYSSSAYSSASSGNGGTINVSSQGNLSTGFIGSSSTATSAFSSSSSSGYGGAINVSSQGTLSTSNIISNTSSASSRYGGAINVSSQGTLSTSDIVSSASSGNGGAINVLSQGTLSTGFIISSSYGNGGAINLSSQGNLSTRYIFSQNNSGGYGGSVNISAGNLFLATGSRTARDGSTNASISTQGVLGGGAITITHGGGTTTPFVVGGATNNGTAAAMTSGSGANTIGFDTLTYSVVPLTVPVPPVVNPYGTNITIRAAVPVPPIEPPIPPIEPPILPVEPIDRSIVTLLTNPIPPSTPNPVIVGTSPILVVENVPVAPTINIPVNTASTGQIIIAPPIINNPTVVVPPPSLTNPQLTRPNLDASPLVQAPLTLATSSSNLPIIDRVPIDSLSYSTRLLDQPFKEEFQAFTSISDEIATLDVSQAQDTLKRIQKEANTKSVLSYVFFSPENEAEQRALNTTSTRGQLNRLPSNTDILQVVLVPPSGDLIRVKYPSLRRPEVIATVRGFTSSVALLSSDYVNNSKKIYNWIVAPFEDDLKRLKIDNLVFLMDSGLRSMPIAALKNDKDKFIIEDYSVGLMPSLSLTNTSYVPMRGSQVFGMGADRFTAPGLGNLPAVSVELNTINQIAGGSTFLNENFTLSNLRQARRPQQRIVHLATHGSFISGVKANSFIQLWGSERLTLDQIRQAGWGSPPVDLLVLSACETASGDREAELGFAGLAIQTGVRSVLASLWEVSDPGTLGLMAEFYQQLQTTTTKAEALRQAQLAMLRGEVRLEAGNLVTPQGNFPLSRELQDVGNKPLTHPFFWSAFALVGSPW